MTFRSVAIGIFGVILLCGFTFFNDMVIRGTFLVGNFLPFSIMGSLILFLLLGNPLLALFGKRWALTGQELAVIIALLFFACFIPGRGFMHHFTNVLMFPHHYTRTNSAWKGDSPRIAINAISDWRKVAKCLRSAEEQDNPAAALIRSHLSPELLATLADETRQQPDSQCQFQALAEFNAIIQNKALHAELRQRGGFLPNYAKYLLQNPDELLSEEELQGISRAAFDVAFGDAIRLRNPGAIAHIPPIMLANPRLDGNALDGFINGLGSGDAGISLRHDIPWQAWRGPLLFWLCLMFIVCASATGLAMVIHRQWFTHEHLPYPTVEFTRMLLPEPGKVISDIFKSRWFWLGLLPVLAVHMNNCGVAWWPDYLIPVRLRYSFSPLLRLFPTYYRSGIGFWALFNPVIYFIVVGFAYFLPKDISLSLGIAPYVFGFITGKLAAYGVVMGGTMIRPTLHTFCYAGSYLAMFAVLMYTGRHYYGSVLRRCLGLRGGDPVEPHAVWGGRLLVLGMLAFVLMTRLAGLEWQISLLYIAAMLVLLTVVSRLLAEAGVFYLHTNLFPCAIIWGFFGVQALGPEQLLLIGMMSCVMFVDPRECFMPYAVEAFALSDRMQCRVGKIGVLGLAVIIIGLAVALPCTMYFQYKDGAIRTGDGWSYGSPPTMAINANNSLRTTMQAQGALHAVDRRSGWQRFTELKPEGPSLVAFAITFSLVIVFTACRHRFPWWPLHPVMFLTLATFQSTVLAFSFIIGWLIKSLVTKFGGGKLYQDLKPLMAGLVAGELLAGVIAIIIGLSYYFVTGEAPKSFAIIR
jgi:hypothetical protein